MKTKLFLIAALVIAFAFISCSEDNAVNDNKNEEEIISLAGTKWKLVGFFDVEKNELTEAEPKDCEECYTLTFHTDTTFSGRTTTNVIGGLAEGKYKIDYITNTLCINWYTTTQVGERGDGELYSQILRKQFLEKNQPFTIENTSPKTLELYYNEGKNYLKYKEIKE
jgi:hypothetical protein